MNKPSRHYTISAGMARQKDITRTFDAAVLVETERAYYLYGHGTTDPEGCCARCARRLTHPGSVLIGIGPECLSIMTAGLDGWEMRAKRFNFSNPDSADVEELKSFTSTITVDGWFPKAAILNQSGENGSIQVPDDHSKLPQAKPADNGKPARTASIDASGKFVIVKFPYDAALVDQVRRLEGRRWNSEKKFWSAWASVENLKALAFLGFALDDTCQRLLNPPKTEEIKIPKELELPDLFPFQNDGVRFLQAHNGNGLIGDEMGLGKTIQAIGWMKLNPDKVPVVIVVPASLKINWEREISKWIGIRTSILSGKKPNPLMMQAPILIVNYDILQAWLPALRELKPAVMVVDESHYIKSNKAQRTKAVRELGKMVKHKIFLSGTPITNRPSEFYTVLNMLDPINFSSWMRYVKRYCGAYHDGYGWNVSGATHTNELFEKINGKLMLRRRKADVLKDLPAKARFVVPMEISNKKDYTSASSDLIRWIKTLKGDAKAMKAATAEALVRFGYLKQLAAEGKRENAVQWIKDSLDSNGKLILFAIHHVMIDYLAEELRNYSPVVVDGRVSMEKRQEAVDKFQNDPECRVFIGNIKAAGVGLTLTVSSNVVFLELPWTPGDCDQAEDRAHRIGQDKKVSIWYLLAANTIEEEIAEILDEKRKVLDAVLDGQETVEENMITELLKRRMEG